MELKLAFLGKMKFVLQKHKVSLDKKYYSVFGSVAKTFFEE